MYLAFVLFTVFVATASSQSSNASVCFPNLGCFSQEAPWVSKLRPLPPPRDPTEYDPHLVLFSPDQAQANNTGSKVRLYSSIKFTEAATHFKVNRQYTIFIITGPGNSKLMPDSWPMQMKNALMNRTNANVFIASNKVKRENLDRFQAAADAPVIARLYVRFIDHLKEKKGLKSSQIWIIGYSDGAHIAGLTGAGTHIGRITGLDPAQQFYQGQPEEVRLDSTDADYVDALHSDARPILPDIGFGVMDRIGHVDFYLNGAHQQPGCRLPRPFELLGHQTMYDAVKEPVRLFAQALLCAHKFAHRVFIASIANIDCTFWGHEGSYENWLKALSNAGSQGLLVKYTALLEPCTVYSCVPLGLDSPKSLLRGIFIITTEGEYPYCVKPTV